MDSLKKHQQLQEKTKGEVFGERDKCFPIFIFIFFFTFINFTNHIKSFYFSFWLEK